MNKEIMQQALAALDLSQSLLEESSHHRTILAAYTALSTAIKQPSTYQVKLVPIRQLFNARGDQVCDTGDETCHFYVHALLPKFGASCNHCQRGIPNNKPHRLCPVIHEST